MVGEMTLEDAGRIAPNVDIALFGSGMSSFQSNARPAYGSQSSGHTPMEIGNLKKNIYPNCDGGQSRGECWRNNACFI